MIEKKYLNFLDKNWLLSFFSVPFFAILSHNFWHQDNFMKKKMLCVQFKSSESLNLFGIIVDLQWIAVPAIICVFWWSEIATHNKRYCRCGTLWSFKPEYLENLKVTERIYERIAVRKPKVEVKIKGNFVGVERHWRNVYCVSFYGFCGWTPVQHRFIQSVPFQNGSLCGQEHPETHFEISKAQNRSGISQLGLKWVIFIY